MAVLEEIWRRRSGNFVDSIRSTQETTFSVRIISHSGKPGFTAKHDNEHPIARNRYRISLLSIGYEHEIVHYAKRCIPFNACKMSLHSANSSFIRSVSVRIEWELSEKDSRRKPFQ